MARSAVEKGEKIAVYGTVKTTLEPSARLISHIAEAEKKRRLWWIPIWLPMRLKR